MQIAEELGIHRDTVRKLYNAEYTKIRVELDDRVRRGSSRLFPRGIVDEKKGLRYRDEPEWRLPYEWDDIDDTDEEPMPSDERRSPWGENKSRKT